MTSHKFTKVFAAAILGALFAAGNASANGGFVSITLGDYDGNRMQYRHVDNDHGFRNHHPGRPGWSGGGIDRLQSKQRYLIRDGIHSGELTPREASRLIAEQREIERLQRVYQYDGRLTHFERQHLLAELDDARRNIWRELNDRQDRGAQPRPWLEKNDRWDRGDHRPGWREHH